MRSPLAAGLLMLACSGWAAAQTVPRFEPSLTVSGQGRMQVPPDHANLTVELVTKERTLNAATAAHRERATRAADALRAMKNQGIDIEQSTFRLDEVRVPRGPIVAPGLEEPEYHAITTFELKTKQLAKIDAAITAIAATGMFEVRNLRFGIDDNNPGVNAARRAAVADARQRAATYAQAAGVQLGDILKIDDTEARGPREFAVGAPMMRSVQVAPPEQMTLSASVTITWRIGGRP